jgi:tRNA-specific 2-thiouridylase
VVKDSIAVAMSGGVDSSMAACLLALEGRPVVGFSMMLVDGLGDGEAAAFEGARAVARRMGFPHHVLDLRAEFKSMVIEPFAAGYAAGRTPSPCIRCNALVKLGSLLARAEAFGAGKVATGHYAVLERDAASGRTLLRRSADLDKDQSYFLFDLTEEQRSRAEFPLGRMRKAEVRRRARELGLDTAGRRESMDLCFVRSGESYRDFLQRCGFAVKSRPGEIVDRDGRIVGSHEGVAGFTVGQRRGIGISSDRKLYVLQVDPERNRVTVGEEADLMRKSCIVERTRWIPFESPEGPIRAKVRIRSTHEGSPATVVDLGKRRAEVRFDEAQRAITPGQAAVFYEGDLVLGGGWIAPP